MDDAYKSLQPSGICLSWKRITTTLVVIDRCRDQFVFMSKFRIQPLYSLFSVFWCIIIFHLVDAWQSQISSCVCLCPALCDFIRRQCRLRVRSNRFCSGNDMSAWHAPLLLQSSQTPLYVIPLFLFSFPSVCHPGVSWIVETQWLLLGCVISLS